MDLETHVGLGKPRLSMFGREQAREAEEAGGGGQTVAGFNCQDSLLTLDFCWAVLWNGVEQWGWSRRPETRPWLAFRGPWNRNILEQFPWLMAQCPAH